MPLAENPSIHRILNFEIVFEHFGYWPSFHDAIIEKVVLEVHDSQSSITLLIATAEFTDELNEKGQYKDFKPCAIEFLFHNIKNTVLLLDHIPVIFEFDFEEVDDTTSCHISSSAGSCTIVAKEITVLSLVSTEQ